MGADVKQTGAEFEASAKYLRWQDKAANQKFFAGELQQFSTESRGAADGARHHQVDAGPRDDRRHVVHQIDRGR